jgi:acyl-CoA thioesterase-1
MRVFPFPLLALLLAFQPMAAQPTLVFLGDSLTAGLGLDRSQAFPSLVEARLRKAGLDWKVVNAGVSGDTSAGALARMDGICRAKPDLLFVCIGSNDGLRGLPVAGLEKNLRAILDRARREKIPVVLAGAMVPDNYGRAYQESFRTVFGRLAREYKVPLMPFLLEGVAMRPELNQEDGIHPNPEGARRVAEGVWRVLEPRIRGVRPSGK